LLSAIVTHILKDDPPRDENESSRQGLYDYCQVLQEDYKINRDAQGEQELGAKKNDDPPYRISRLGKES